MPSYLNLNSYKILNLLLILFFSIIVSSNIKFYYLNLFFYSIFHFCIIYLVFYYYRNVLYLIFFLYGLGLDILLINQIGPHLIVFLSVLLIYNLISKYLYHLNYINIYIILLTTIFAMICLEKIISFMLFGSTINIQYLFEINFLTTLLSFPVFYIFSKIDNIK